MEAELRRLLDELQAAIQRTREGHEDRDELAQLVDEVERRLQPEESEDRSNLVDALRAAEARFEASHPLLGAAIRRAVDALSAAGI